MKFFLVIISLFVTSFLHASPKYYAKFQYKQQSDNNQVTEQVIGQVIGNKIQPLSGDLFGKLTPTGKPISLSDVTLLLPTQPQKVFAVGMNFASHLSSPSDEPPPLFLKLPSSLIATGQTIHLPKDASNVHFEGELVLIIGKEAKNISEEDAHEAIFGVTVGNDLTDRNWQSSDLQWMRAKAADGFGPVGSVIASGVDFNDLLLTTKLNGKVVQQENTKYMIHKPAKVVSYLSQYFTLMPGDLIFMGTPGRTKKLVNGDIVSVSIDKVGSVENTIKAMH